MFLLYLHNYFKWYHMKHTLYWFLEILAKREPVSKADIQWPRASIGWDMTKCHGTISISSTYIKMIETIKKHEMHA